MNDGDYDGYYGRPDRKTDDIDPEWLSKYLKRHHSGNVQLQMQHFANGRQQRDKFIPEVASDKLSPPDWVKLRSAWRQHQYRESKKSDIEAWRESVIQFKEWCAEMGADPAGALLAAMDILDDDPVRIGQMMEEIRQRKEAAESKRKKSAAAKKRYQKKKAAAAAEAAAETKPE
jgi:hypothetical protein